MKINRRVIDHDWGLLLLRLGLGGMFIIAHGYGKITSPDSWEGLGSALGSLGLPVFAPKFFGFMAAFAEFGGAILLMLGLLYRPAAFLLLFTMIVATAMHIAQDPAEGMTAMKHFSMKTSRPLELAFVFAAMLVAGPGRYALDTLIFKKNRR